MKLIAYISTYAFFMVNILLAGCTNQAIPCQEGINLIPMYGNGKIKKCKEQLEADAEFITMVQKSGSDLTEVSNEMVNSGLNFLKRGDYDTAMKRMNQAWLLDNMNIYPYIYFIELLDIDNKQDEAKQMLDLTLKKIISRKNPTTPTATDSSNEMLVDIIVANTLKAYDKTQNTEIAEYLYTNIDKLDFSDARKNTIKHRLKTEVSGLK